MSYFDNLSKRFSAIYSCRFFLLCLALPITACVPRFSGVAPTSGEICEQVNIQRDPERWHRCGTFSVTFNGVASTDVSLASGTEPEDIIAVIPPGASSGPLIIRQNSGSCTLIGFFSKTQTLDPMFEVTGSPTRPSIVSFNASDTDITAGEAVTLNWTVSLPSEELTLNTIGGSSLSVLGRSSIEVSPETDSTYRLTARNRCLSVSQTLAINVQERPLITSVDDVYPGERLRARGSNLSSSNSNLIIQQNSRNSGPIRDPSPSSTSLDVILPTEFVPGPASIEAQVDTLTSPSYDFIIKGRESGQFIDITSQLLISTPTAVTCGESRSLVISGSGENRTASFYESGRLLFRETFNVSTGIRGAAFSPDCLHGVVAGHNSFTTTNSVLTVQDLANGRNRFSDNTLGQSLQILFSPDDSVLLHKSLFTVSGTTSSSTNYVIGLYDMQRNRNIPATGPQPCGSGSCSGLSARVLDNYRDVSINFNASTLGPYPIE
ncbi:hypothetical protein [Kangiella sp. TOML190]|uniref:hypothetical protein n=1 Tax=Kangiella sp. TOML190 TaxID=2931351 RepID=UPI00203C5470|nr:hypothetical protein [Kangiella sp. TOML190]